MIFSHFSEPQGHKYQEVSGQCCGQCMLIACILTLDSSPAQVIKVSYNFANSPVQQIHI